MRDLLSLAVLTLWVAVALAKPPQYTIDRPACYTPDIVPVATELTYEEAYAKAIWEGKPLVVFMGYGDGGPVPGAVTYQAIKAWDGYQHGDIVVSSPFGGKLYYVGTYRKRSEINLLKAMKAVPTYTYRQSSGHSHTCPFHPDDPWDHLSNPGHQCPQCGTTVTVQDRTPRMIRTATAAQPKPVVTSQSFGSSSGGCASGNCSTSSGRASLFRR